MQETYLVIDQSFIDIGTFNNRSDGEKMQTKHNILIFMVFHKED